MNIPEGWPTHEMIVAGLDTAAAKKDWATGAIIVSYNTIADTLRASLAAAPTQPTQEPIPMLLYCPACGMQHIEEKTDTWDNPPHRSHLCHYCNHIWRPSDVATAGIKAVATRGSEDSDIVAPVQNVPDRCDRIIWRGTYYHLPLKSGTEQITPGVIYQYWGWDHWNDCTKEIFRQHKENGLKTRVLRIYVDSE